MQLFSLLSQDGMYVSIYLYFLMRTIFNHRRYQNRMADQG